MKSEAVITVSVTATETVPLPLSKKVFMSISGAEKPPTDPELLAHFAPAILSQSPSPPTQNLSGPSGITSLTDTSSKTSISKSGSGEGETLEEGDTEREEEADGLWEAEEEADGL